LGEEAARVLGTAATILVPQQQQQQQQSPWTPMHGASWDPSALVNSFNTMTLTPPSSGEWHANSSAGAHMVNNDGILSSIHPPLSSSPSSIIVGNGASLPATTSIGSHSFSSTQRPLVLSNVLASPHIIKNLLSVCRFTMDNNCSIEFIWPLYEGPLDTERDCQVQ
jgi:hypothetical protein